MGRWKNEVETMEENKLVKMRELYSESDQLKIKLEFYKNQFEEELKNKK